MLIGLDEQVMVRERARQASQMANLGRRRRRRKTLLSLQEKVPHCGLVLAAISRADSRDECAQGTCEM